jgi:glycosyltransferase involved in cell wall biosynthesis
VLAGVAMSKDRLLWHSNAPWTGTGYGQQTAVFAQRLKDHYNLTISAFYGLEGCVIPWNGIPVLPGIGQTYGNETIEEHARTILGDDLRSGLVFSLMDVWVLDPLVWRNLDVASWVPVDHVPVPGPVRRFFENSGAVPIAMSKFGQEQLADLDPLYVPHGIETDVYKPIPQAEAREATGMDPDAYFVGMVAANKGNPSRKCFTEAFLAFKQFHKKHPEAKLYLHTEVTGRFQGVPLLPLLDSIGIPQDATVFADQYRACHFPFPGETMAQVFSSLDVLLAPSAGEGFGIPVVEAQACGVPVIVSDFSAQPELVGAGWCVEGTKKWTPIGAWQFQPDVGDIAHALDCAYSEKGNPLIAKKARAKAEEYDADRVLTEHMLPALEQARERLDERKPQKLAVAA